MVVLYRSDRQPLGNPKSSTHDGALRTFIVARARLCACVGGEVTVLMESAEVRVPDGEGEVLGPPLPGPLLHLSMEEREMESCASAVVGRRVRECLGEKSQGVAAATPYRTKDL